MYDGTDLLAVLYTTLPNQRRGMLQKNLPLV
jgi:hypothetical protein